MTNLTVFANKVLTATKKIPRGKVTTYKLLAQVVGQPQAIRAVGNALKKNPQLIKVPCHRVIRSDGKIGGYRLGLKKKLFLLRKEGIKFSAKGGSASGGENNQQIKNLNNFLFTP